MNYFTERSPDALKSILVFKMREAFRALRRSRNSRQLVDRTHAMAEVTDCSLGNHTSANRLAADQSLVPHSEPSTGLTLLGPAIPSFFGNIVCGVNWYVVQTSPRH